LSLASDRIAPLRLPGSIRKVSNRKTNRPIRKNLTSAEIRR
jgi:hypothetical protein